MSRIRMQLFAFAYAVLLVTPAAVTAAVIAARDGRDILIGMQAALGTVRQELRELLSMLEEPGEGGA